MSRRPSLLRFVLRGYGAHMARAWAFWPQLFWLMVLVAVVNSFAAVTILLVGPLSTALAPAVTILFVSSAIFVGLVAGFLHKRREKRNGRGRTGAVRDRPVQGDAIPPPGLPTQRTTDGGH